MQLRTERVLVAPSGRAADVPLVAIAAVAVLVLLLFKLLPAGLALLASLTDARLLSRTVSFTGLDNYARLLADTRFWGALQVSAAYAAGIVVAGGTIGLALASALRHDSPWSWAMRVGFLLPAVVPAVVAAAIWMRLFEPTFGLVNAGLARLGVVGPAWLHDPVWALPALVIVGVWREAGLAMAVFVAALRRLPREVEAAAACDGATPLQTWRLVTLPLLRPAMALVAVTTALRCFEHFTPFYVMSGGGPAGATTSWTFFLYTVGFGRQDLGYASAAAVTVSVGLGLLMWIAWAQLRRSWGAAA